MLHRIRALFRPRTRLLFVCSQNRLRSRTAEDLSQGARVFPSGPPARCRSRVRVDAALVAWADRVFGMEAEHVRYVLAHFAEVAAGKPVVSLEIPDDYDYMAPELVALLEARVAAYLTPA